MIKLYLDEDVPLLLAPSLRHRDFDAVHTNEVNRKGSSDKDQFDYASRNNQAILTHDIRDYILLYHEYQKQGIKHSGIILSDQIEFRELLRRTLKFLSLEKKIQNQLIWLSGYK